MAKRDIYNFQIKGDNQQAKESFEELKRLAEELETTSSNVKIDPDKNSNLTEFIRTMTETLNTYTELTKAMDEEHTVKLKMGGQQELAKELTQSRRMVEKETREMMREVEKTFNSYYQQTGKRIRITPSPSENLDTHSDTKRRANQAREQAEEIANRTKNTLSIGRRALDSKYINHSQASDYRGNISDLLGEKYQGASLETVLKGEKFTPVKGSVRANALEGQDEARQGIAERQANIKRIKTDPNLNPSSKDNDATAKRKEELRNSLLNKNTDEISDLKNTIKSLQDVIEGLDTTARNLGEQSATFEGADVREKDDRSTTMGRMFERASAIGLAITGAVAYSVGSKYQKGVQATDEQRPQSLNLGYQTGNSDFRGIRQDLMDEGAPRGWKGKDMLDFAETVIGGTGFQDKDTLNEMTTNLSDFAKFSGAGQQESTSYMEGLYKSGAVSTSEQAKAIQDGFLGAIKMSGMEGREKEQLEALTTINENLFRGREVTNEEANNRLAMTSILSDTGNKALQGDNLAGFMTSMDDSIKGASPFSTMGSLMGVGSDPSISSYYDYVVRKQQGFSEENARNILENATANGRDSKDAAGIIYDASGESVNIEAVKEILDRYPSGIPQEELDKVISEINSTGTEEKKAREEAYDNSPDAAREAAEAYAEKLATLLSENKVVDELVKIKEGINKWGAQNPATAAITSIGAGLASGITMGISSAIATGLGTGISKIFSTKFSPALKSMAGTGGFTGAIGSVFTKGSNIWSKLSGATEATEATAKTASNLGKTVDTGGDVLNAASKSGGMGSKLIKGASKAAPWITLGLDALRIGTAKDKVKETGKVGGEALGALGGAKVGALAGSFFGPMGTLVGGLAGGAIGAWGGNKLGGKAVDMFRGDKVSAAELDPEDQMLDQENTATEQEKQAQATQQMYAEQLRTSNVNSETENLKKLEDLLSQIDILLAQSRAQNGIVGNIDGADTGTGTGSDATAQGLKTVGNGDYWTNTDITKHDLSTTSNAITGKELDKWISSQAPKGSNMLGMGDTFMKAGEASGLDPRYLVAHAAHETGWGTSQISKDKGNMYGIGAFDASPYSSAYGYDNTQAGIIEGAKWISDNYYSKGQKDLDSMRHNGGKHEYATDPLWDEKIANIMKGSEKYTSPSTKVNVTTNVTLNGSGNNDKDARMIADKTSSNISKAFTQELVRT